MDFSILLNKKIYAILIGDQNVFDEYSLPYLSGPDLCTLCSQFGLPRTYRWQSGNVSRWMYMQDLMEFLNKQNKISDLLSFLFQRSRFTNLNSIGNIHKINEVYSNIVSGALFSINSHLLIAGKEIRLLNKHFIIANIGEEVAFEAPKVRVVTSQYIRELPERIKDDIANHDYDSVITKSRTLLEEVLIYIIEKITKERYKSNGDLVKIYQEATDLLNMRQKKEWDKRVNELLGGLHKMVGAISSMRNINSDAHGAGSARIEIKEREAILVAHSSMIIAEYWLSVLENKH